MSLTVLEDYNVILASRSPRRREILARAGLSFGIRPASDREVTEETAPERIVMALAAHKAREVYEKLLAERGGAAEDLPGGFPMRSLPFFVIGADTVVVIGGEILGKPEDPAHAAKMLRLLSGASHEVLTGVCLIAEMPAPRGASAGTEGPGETPGDSCAIRERIFFERTKVHFRELTEEEIADYVAGGEPMDKAGAYGIQGKAGAFVEYIEGDYDNVVGFPLARFLEESEAFLASGVKEDGNASCL